MAVRRSTQHVVALLVAAVAAFAVVLVAPVRVDGGEVAWGESCAEATVAQATINVGMVVDFGILKGAGDPRGQRVTCVPVPSGSSGIQLLEAAGHDYRLNGSGLLCAIDGLPAGNECGERTPSGSYRYWAYFHSAGSSWSYSGIGPSSYRATAPVVEGWHFVEGAGNPGDPPPRRAPTTICPVAPPPTAPPTTPRPVAPTTTPVTPSVPSPAPSGPSVDPGAAPSGNAPAATTTVPGATPADGTPDPTDGSTDGSATDPSVSAGEPGAGAPTGTVAGHGGDATDVTILTAAQSGSSGSGAGGGAPLATIVVVLVVAALGGVAAWRFRFRSDDIG